MENFQCSTPTHHHENRTRTQLGRQPPRLPLHHHTAGPAPAGAAYRHRRQHGTSGQAAQTPQGQRRRAGARAGALWHRAPQIHRQRHPNTQSTGQRRAGDHRGPPGRHPARVGGAPYPDRAGQLLQQRACVVSLGPGELQAGHVAGRVHPQPAVCRSAAADGRAQAALLTGRSADLCHWCALRQGLEPAGQVRHRCGEGMGWLRIAARIAEGHRAGSLPP